MSRNLPSLGLLFFLVAVAAGGYFVAGWIPFVVSEYQKAAAFHPYWGYAYLTIILLSAAAFLALAIWILGALVVNTRRKRAQSAGQKRNPSQMSRAEQEAEIRGHLAAADALANDAEIDPALRQPLRDSMARLDEKLQSQSLEIVAFGTVSSGKSALLNALAGRDVFRSDVRAGTTAARNEIPWPGDDRVVLVDTPGLAEIDGQTREGLARSAARDADLVLFVTDGPLKDFEYDVLRQLAEMEKRIVVCLNKADWFAESDRALLAGQIADQVKRFVPPENVVVVRAQPAARTRVRVLPDGREVEEPIDVQADLQPLAERMMAIIGREGQDLLLANLLLQSRGMIGDAKRQVRVALDQRAQQIVDRTMWQAGAAAALSPLPVFDVAAALAFNTRMVLELARVYRQNVDLETASRLLGELGKNLLSILGASAATPLVATGMASALKTVPGAGTIAGGVLQGLVQALVTRWIGQVFITYFREEMKEPPQGWAALARAKWDQITQPEELTRLVTTGIKRWGARSE